MDQNVTGPEKVAPDVAEPSPDTGVMTRNGYYDHHSATQQQAAARGLELVRVAAADLVVGERVVTVADLGCAQGHNSLEPMAAAVETLRQRCAADIDVVHTDLPTNDWATLFHVIEHDPASYLDGHRRDVHPSVIGRSFYEGLFAPATLSLAWISSALHWLSSSPGPVADHFFVQSSTDAAAKARYRSVAATDWIDFLTHRSVELVPTGAIVFVDVLMGDDGTMGSEALFDTLETSLRAAHHDGRITDAEYESIAYPTWFRSLAELQEPFAPQFGGPDGQLLELVELEPAELDDPFLAAYQATGDASAYGQAQAGFLRGFLEPSFRAALAARSTATQTALLDAVFAETARCIALDPDGVSPRYQLVTGRIRRTR